MDGSIFSNYNPRTSTFGPQDIIMTLDSGKQMVQLSSNSQFACYGKMQWTVTMKFISTVQYDLSSWFL